MTQHVPCLIQPINCGRKLVDPVWVKCGMDARIVYPSEADRDTAVTAAKAQDWVTHARRAETQQAQAGHTNSNAESKLSAAGAWPLPTDNKSQPKLATPASTKSDPVAGQTGSELPKILTAGAVSVAANAVLGMEGWPRYVVTILCFAVVYGLWTLLQGNGKQDH